MQKFDFNITFKKDADGNYIFDKVTLNSGKEYNVNAWNFQFTNLDPKDQNVGTNVTNTQVETNYDPD